MGHGPPPDRGMRSPHWRCTRGGYLVGPRKHRRPCQVTEARARQGGGSLPPAHVTLLGSETASESDSICLHLPSFGVCAHAHIKDPRAPGSPGVTGRFPQPLSSFVNDPKGLDQWGLCSADSERSRRGRKRAAPGMNAW